jgi:hypothetical protein
MINLTQFSHLQPQRGPRMTTSLSTPVLLGLAGVVGILVGLLLATLFRSEPKAAPEENPLPKKFADTGYAEVVRLFFSPAEKKSLTQIDGDFYPEFSSLTPEQKKRVMRILESWNEWAGYSAQNTSSAPSAVSPTPVHSTLISSGEERKSAPPPPLPSSNRPIAKIEEVKANTFLESLERTSEKVPEKSGPPKTIIEQINDILTGLIANTAEKDLGVTLVDNGHEGVIVWVGLEKFNGVDAVPYPEVQQLIRTAVARWEESSTPQPKE